MLRPIHNHALFLRNSSKLVSDILVVEKKMYAVENISDVPEELQPQNICAERGVRRRRRVPTVFGKDSPLSKWYSARIKIQGIVYSSVKHYYMYKKALCAKDTKRAADILKTGGKNVRINKEEWKVQGVYKSSRKPYAPSLYRTGSCR